MRRFASRIRPFFYQEPFRIFFPAGLAIGIIGVALWPLYYAGWIVTYPGTSHARLMIEGFMASFIIGFLGTAGPRITSTSPFSRNAVVALLTLNLLAAGLHFGGADRAGNLLFVACIGLLLFLIGKRFVRRKDSPPPNLALVALGLLNGLAGALLLAVFENQRYTASYRLGSMFLEQGFVLLPILGIAPFLLPRLLNASLPDLPESRALPPGWKRRAVFAAGIGLIVDLTFVLEAFRLTLFAPWLRFGAILIYLLATMQSAGRSFLADSLRVGIGAIIIGIGCEALWPLSRVGALHIIFISGFGFIAMTVGIRVVFGHSGNSNLFRKPLPFFVIVGTLVFLAAFSRYVADIAPAARVVHLMAAAIFWLIAALIWAIKVLPKVVIVEPE